MCVCSGRGLADDVDDDDDKCSLNIILACVRLIVAKELKRVTVHAKVCGYDIHSRK